MKALLSSLYLDLIFDDQKTRDAIEEKLKEKGLEIVSSGIGTANEFTGKPFLSITYRSYYKQSGPPKELATAALLKLLGV